MIKYGIAVALAAAACALELRTYAEAEIQALLEQEQYSENSTEPCAFPNVTRFNTPEY